MNNQELRNIIRESINVLMDNIDVPINVGDTVLGGKFKNKKIKVKDIDKNEKGDITINDKPLLRVRIPKEVSEGSVKTAERIDIYRDNNYVVVRPLSEKASCKYGAFTKWCISAPSSGAWDSNPDAIVIMILQKSYQITPQRQELIDNFIQLKEAKEDGEMTPEMEEELDNLYRTHDYHDFEDLSKIALVFSESGGSAEIWDANNINIDDNYQFGWTYLPISNNVKNAISEYIDSLKTIKNVAEGFENTEVYNVYYTKIDPTGGGVEERILLNKNPFIHQRAANQFALYQAKKHKVQIDKTHTAAWGSNNVIQIFPEKK